MDKIKIIGGNPLFGKIYISGAKNSALAIMAAVLLTEEDIKISNIPHLVDIKSMSNLLINMGVELTVDGRKKDLNIYTGRTIIFNAKNIKSTTASYELVRKMRASILVLGPLLARFGYAEVSLPGGCAIGARPVDMHLKALEKMGAVINIEDGYVKASGKLKGTVINFDKVSVGATENILMAACLADGETTINNAAKEPEIIDLANLLNKMGAKISGIGSSVLKVIGVKKLHEAEHEVIFDRIEAATYAVAALITKGEIELLNCQENYLPTVLDKLKEAGAKITIKENSIIISGKNCETINPLNIITNPYPELATDVQAQFMSLLTLADGTSTITESIFENRFMHAAELMRMGAKISLDGNQAIVTGISKLKGAEVMATDLRASVALVLAGLVAEGETIISRIYHLDRGYEWPEEKLANCGANIKRLK